MNLSMGWTFPAPATALPLHRLLSDSACRRPAPSILCIYMAKPANLSDEAYDVLHANKRNKKESLSQVILRVVPKPIRTFGDLERHLESLDDTVFDRIDVEALRRVRERKV